MTRRISLNSLFLVFLLASVVSASAAGQKVVLKWKEDDNRIIHDSVCYNHDYGSVPYRRCRTQAKKHFKKRCGYYQKKYRRAKSPYASEFKNQMDKFCHSARQFAPV
ncbi:MAG: hypothetical protein ABW148_06320 [Sedimenticola sp.]